ncbi:Lrp/AsnC family transcriptional regulator [Streptomyces sp. SID8499]|nr:Lrp/AsnC family transcriptional regulator [Streptomyces sp. SID8499]NED35781.1 Lrp/AsnC family transcriptional regulator [Streptomyces sp. SID8499]
MRRVPHPAPRADSAASAASRLTGDVTELTETDLALVEALQLHPRAPWARIGAVIGIDATTAARRWRRLTGSGTAWMTAYPTHHASLVGYVDLACEPAAVEPLTRRLRSWGPVFSIERTTGVHQLFLGVAARDLPSLDDFAVRRLGGLGGVRSVRLSVCTAVHREGSGWLVHALSERQRADLRDGEPHGRPRPGTGPYESDRRLLLALGADARRGHAELARECGLSETTVRRRLRRMINGGEIHFRCDLTQRLAGWPVVATFRIAVPGPGGQAVAKALAGLPETRLCSSVTGADNLLLSVWLRSPGDCVALEERILHRHPGLRISERSITLHTAKRMGRLLDRDGRARAHVPMTAAAEGEADGTTGAPLGTVDQG